MPGKAHDYIDFANRYSVPMFKMQNGILGLHVLIKDDKSLVLSYWRKREDMEAMETNELYIQTGDQIRNAGILMESPQVEIYEVPIALPSINGYIAVL